MDCLDDNRDRWLKKSEFTEFFVDAVVRLEGNDESWLSVLSKDTSGDKDNARIACKVKRFATDLLTDLKQNDDNGKELTFKRKCERLVRTSASQKEEAAAAVAMETPEVEQGGEDFFNVDEFQLAEDEDEDKNKNKKVVEVRAPANTVSELALDLDSDSDLEGSLMLIDDTDDEDEEDGHHEIAIDLSDVDEDLGFSIAGGDDLDLDVLASDDDDDLGALFAMETEVEESGEVVLHDSDSDSDEPMVIGDSDSD